MSFVAIIPTAAADCDRIGSRLELLLDSFENFSARATISLAEAMRASRSSKAVPITASLFLRLWSPLCSRPAMPTPDGLGVLERSGVEVPDVFVSDIRRLSNGRGAGGALVDSHFRCIIALLRRSEKTLSPPARKENLTLVISSISSKASVDISGPGD